MQCSGIHRSLGVHISKVRSATLDTWLPEQVAFIQSMGNEKANSYWEAELPPNYDRVGIENFIRAKYDDKRWVPRDGKAKSPPRRQDESYLQRPKPVERSKHGHTSSSENLFEGRRNSPAQISKDRVPATRISIPVPPKGPEQVSRVTPPKAVQKVEPVAEPAEAVKKAVDPTATATQPKVDYATDLFNMLSLEGPNENGSEAASSDDNGWAGFQSATANGEASITDKADPQKMGSNNTHSTPVIEDLFKDEPSLATSSLSQKPQKDVKTDIMSLFEKSNMVSPYAMHQQQIAMLAQQQSLLMAAAAKSAGGSGSTNSQQQLALLAQQQSLLMAAAAKSAGGSGSTNGQQPGANGINLPAQTWPNAGYQIPGLMVPVAMQSDVQKLMQVLVFGRDKTYTGLIFLKRSSFYSMGQGTPVVNGASTTAGASKPQSATPVVASSNSSQTGKEFDFSSLTQGMFSKH
ncbi:unnamed protein product [Linum tenue]|uniref:Arf-GAP domain-containing protein n=1 Tax=Linum tenue TaxID=586396 RepID=A0AAV0GUQ0_9ROSI|nr:unnamed protein product [Linum tenue]